MQKIMLLSFAVIFSTVIVNAQDIVHVRNYNAIPGDTLDDAAGIQAALNYAKAHDIKRVEFAAGTYLLNVISNKSLNAYFGLENFTGLQLAGTMKNGLPVTWLVKHNPQLNQAILPSHARFDNCDSLLISGFVFDNTPQYATAGTVVEKGAGYVSVEIYNGLPAVDGMACYTANIWDTATKNLKQLPSLSFSVDVAKENLYWQHSTVGGKHYMRMNNTRFASSLKKGDGLSWHFGAPTMFQLAIYSCDNLELNDLLTVNIAGWGIMTSGCNNIKSKRVRFVANGKQLAVGPRDAWKIHHCNGDVVVDSMEVNGVRWDGQNVHSPFFIVKEKLTNNTFRVYKRFGNTTSFINDTIRFWHDSIQEKRLVTDWQFVQQADDGIYGVVSIRGRIPAFVTDGTLATMDALDIDHYTLKNSTFRNIAGCASVIKTSKGLISNCSFDHIMYPAIVFGVETAEATFPQDILVDSCSFNASGWVARSGTKGLVGIGSGAYKRIKGTGSISFNNCTFSNAEVGIDASYLKKVEVKNSVFTNVQKPYKFREGTITEIITKNNVQ
jgi:hypothetical protein